MRGVNNKLQRERRQKRGKEKRHTTDSQSHDREESGEGRRDGEREWGSQCDTPSRRERNNTVKEGREQQTSVRMQREERGNVIGKRVNNESER